MRGWKVVAAVLICLVLTACGAGHDGGSDKAAGDAGDENSAVLLTVDGRGVAAWQYRYWLDFTCDQLRGLYQEAGIPLDWDAPSDGGGTLADYAKAQALSDVALYAVVEAWAEKYGVTLDDGDTAELANMWAKECAAHGGEKENLARLAAQGLDHSRWEALTRTGLLYGKLCQLYCTEGGPLSELAPNTPELMINRIFVSAGGDREAAYQRAAELFSRLNSAEDQAAAFEALTTEGDDDAGPRALKPGALPAALEEAAAALEENQISGILEAEDGYSILLRLPNAAPPLDADSFDRLLESAAEAAEIETTEAYASITPSTIEAEANSEK